VGLAHKVGQDRTEAGPTGTYWISGAGSPGSEELNCFRLVLQQRLRAFMFPRYRAQTCQSKLELGHGHTHNIVKSPQTAIALVHF
jgi:hypothetical protein